MCQGKCLNIFYKDTAQINFDNIVDLWSFIILFNIQSPKLYVSGFSIIVKEKPPTICRIPQKITFN